MKIKAPNIVVRICIAMVAGILVGHFFKDFAVELEMLSHIFLRMIKMIIAPLVLSTLVVGIGKISDFKTIGRIGLKTILYFQFASALALTVGLLAVNILQPGKVMDLSHVVKAAPEEAIKANGINFKEVLYHIFPTSIFDAMANNEILQIIVFAVFFGVATSALKDKGEAVLNFFDSLSHIMFRVTNYVMNLAPFGVFGAIAAAVSKQGLGIFQGYAYLILSFFGALLFFVFCVLSVICLVLRIPFFKLLSYIKEPLLLAFSTSSSEAAFPKSIEALERFGCGNRIISFVLPLSYSFNLDGSILYMSFATVFIAQAYGIAMSFQDQLTMVFMLLITSKGMAGVPRASLVVIAATLQTFNLPTEGLLFLLGIDWLLDMGRSATNVVGNAVATAVISKWEGAMHEEKPSIDIDEIELRA